MGGGKLRTSLRGLGVVDMSHDSAGFKAGLVARMAGPESISANALSQEVGVSQGTLSRWLREARTVGTMSSKSKRNRVKGRPRAFGRADVSHRRGGFAADRVIPGGVPAAGGGP